MPPSAVIGHMAKVSSIQDSRQRPSGGRAGVYHEKRARHVPEDKDWIMSSDTPAANDVTAHIGETKAIPRQSVLYLLPLGPCMVTGLDPDN